MEYKATEQGVFDYVVEHLKRQGVASFGKGPDGSLMCLYRGPDGTSCAIGCLLTDDEVSGIRENETVEKLVENHKLPRRLNRLGAPFLTSLQSAHDDGYKMNGGWIEALLNVAYVHDLDDRSVRKWQKEIA